MIKETKMTLEESLARFSIRGRTTSIPEPQGFDEESFSESQVTPNEVTEMLNEEVKEVSNSTEVEVTAQEPVAPVMEEPVKVEPVNKPSKKFVSITRLRVDGSINTDMGVAKPMRNRGLKQFRDDIFGSSPKDTVPEEYVLDGVLVKNTGEPAIWEEGGADFRSGYVLLVADSKGNKKIPAICYHDRDISNGKHALVPVAQGDLVLLGVQEGDCCVVVAEVGEMQITPQDKNKLYIKVHPVLRLETDDEENAIDYAYERFNFIDEKHPLLVAGCDRVYEQFCHEPAYVTDYAPYTFDNRLNIDINNAFANKDFLASLQLFDTTDEAYDALELALAGKVSECAKTENVLITAILNINKDDSGNECIYVFVIGCVFNNAKSVNSSAGKRFFYGRVKLTKNDTFTYIDDRSTRLTYDQAMWTMNSRGKKWIAEAVRRMTA